MHKLYVALLCCLLAATPAVSQIALTQLPSGGNKKAWVGERVGLTDISIHYDRPGVKGREGHIWGELVPAGFTDQGFGSSKAAPWRAGANENSSIEFSTDVTIEGKPLKAGKYGFFIAFDAAQPTLIFSANASSWGSYFYNEKEDALRVQVKTEALPERVEWLRYQFLNQTENSAVIALEWEKLRIPFKVEVDYVKDQLASFRRELRTERGFYWLAWQQAAHWALQHNTNLEEALLWADSASGPTFGGDRQFQPQATKAQLLEKLGRTAEADALMKKALPLAGVNELHQYGRSLLQQKKTKEALAVFQENYKKHGAQFTTLMGLMRGYSANADFKNALKYARLAQPLAPDELNRNSVAESIKKLQEGKDINGL